MRDPGPTRHSRLRLLRNARREARLVLLLWAACLLWVVGYSYLHGYERPADAALVRWGIATARDASGFRAVLGIPDWVFFGIALPWAAATAITIVFGFRVIADDDLGEEAGEGPQK